MIKPWMLSVGYHKDSKVTIHPDTYLLTELNKTTVDKAELNSIRSLLKSGQTTPIKLLEELRHSKITLGKLEAGQLETWVNNLPEECSLLAKLKPIDYWEQLWCEHFLMVKFQRLGFIFMIGES